MKVESIAKKTTASQPSVKQSAPKENTDKLRAIDKQQWDKARKALYEYWQGTR